MTVDIESSYHLSTHIVATNLRPDIVLGSDIKKEVIFTELTICFETNFVEARE